MFCNLAKCRIAASPIKELIALVREGFNKINNKLGSIYSKLDIIAAKQGDMIEKIDEAHEDIVSEAKGLRSGQAAEDRERCD